MRSNARRATSTKMLGYLASQKPALAAKDILYCRTSDHSARGFAQDAGASLARHLIAHRYFHIGRGIFCFIPPVDSMAMLPPKLFCRGS